MESELLSFHEDSNSRTCIVTTRWEGKESKQGSKHQTWGERARGGETRRDEKRRERKSTGKKRDPCVIHFLVKETLTNYDLF